MNKKEFLRNIGVSFFIVVTCVNVAMGVLGLIFEPEQRFGYEAFFMPILYGIIGIIPSAVISSKKELTVKQMVYRKILEIFFVELLLTGFLWSNDVREGPVIASFMASVFLICILVELVLWLLNISAARRLNEDLAKFKKSIRENMQGTV